MMRTGLDTLGEYRVSKSSQKETGGTALAYVVFLAVAGFVFYKIAEGEFSSILTIAAIFQCLAFSLLGVQVLFGNVSGVSTKSLQLEAIAIASRLVSTTLVDGYVPSDTTGDYLYQCFDGLSLVMALWITRRVLNARREEGDEAEEDCLPVAPFAVVCLVLSFILHSDLNDNPVFDGLWINCLFVKTIAVVPQLLMMTRKGCLPALTSHFVAVMGLSQVLSGTYMWHAYDELTCEPWIGNFNHAAPAILGAHLIHVVILLDFAYLYVRNVLKFGWEAPVQLNNQHNTWTV